MSIYSRKVKVLGKNGRKIIRVKNIVEQASNGKRIFSVVFTKKKDGSERRMTCHNGVKKYLKGGKSTIRHKKELVSTYEMKGGYKCFSVLRLKQVKGNGRTVSLKHGKVINY